MEKQVCFTEEEAEAMADFIDFATLLLEDCGNVVTPTSPAARSVREKLAEFAPKELEE